MDSKILAMAEQTCLRSTMKFRMSAIIFNHHGILAKGYNHQLTVRDPVLIRRIGLIAWSIHAEQDALSKVKGIDLKGYSIYVHRYRRNLALPCVCCLPYILDRGIEEIFYSCKGEILRWQGDVSGHFPR